MPLADRKFRFQVVNPSVDLIGDMKTSVRFYRVERAQISFVKFILEAYDNMAVLSTFDSQKALVQLTIAPGCEPLVADIMNRLAETIFMTPVDPGSPNGPADGENEMPPAW